MKRLYANFENDYSAFLSGYGSRELLTEMRGRAPVWNVSRRAWVTAPHTLRDVIAVAESRGYDVVISQAGCINDPGMGRW